MFNLTSAAQFTEFLLEAVNLMMAWKRIYEAEKP
jgi:hypothetical protein